MAKRNWCVGNAPYRKRLGVKT